MVEWPLNSMLSMASDGSVSPVVTTSLEPAITPGTTLQYWAGDKTWRTYTGVTARSFNNAPTVSLVTTAAAANGVQVSATRDAEISYTVTTSSTATIGGASTATVVLEICATNSAVAADWTEVSKFSNGQTITLAVVLQSVQVVSSSLRGTLPAGWYRRLRQTLTGTASASVTTGQEVLL